MKALPLLACLALLAAPLRAQDAAGRDDLLSQIATWRAEQLVHVSPPDPLTAEFEPRLDEIAAKVKDAQGADELVQPQKDFKTWQHDLLAKKFVVTRQLGLTASSLDKFSSGQRGMIQMRLKETLAATDGRAGQFFDGGGEGAAAVAAGRAAGSSPRADGAAPAPGLHINEAPEPAPSAKPWSLNSLRDYFDHSGISDAVVESVEKIKNEVAGVGHLLSGFAGTCYYGVKWMMIKTHMLPPEVKAPEEIGKIGIGSGDAYMMSAALKHDPKLQAKLRVRSLDLTTVKDADASLIPERTLFVFDRGCAGFSEESGHIEYTLAREKMADLSPSVFYRVGRRGKKYKPTLDDNEVLACSDGCMVHTMAFLRTYGRKKCLNAYVPVTE
jgi:hypothetical protein